MQARFPKKTAVAGALAASIVLGGIVPARPAFADPSDNQAAAAESLFQEARRLMEAKRYAEACPKLAASHKLAPAVGTLLNLADCYERNGQLASAWIRFHDAVALAQRLNRPDREKTAKERADRIEPRLIRLTISSKESGLDVKLDGNPLDSAALGTPVPIDPGKHTIDASKAGKKPYSTTIDLSDRSHSPSVEIPMLETDPDAVKSTPPPIESPKPHEEPKGDDGSTQRILGIVGMGVGVAGVAVGTIFGLRTSSKWHDAQDNHCGDTTACDVTGVEEATQAKNSGTVSTIAFIAGGAFLAGGAIVFFTAPSGSSPDGTHKKTESAFGIGPGSFVWRGTF